MQTLEKVFLLKKIHYQDAHLILTFLGENLGRFSALAYQAKVSQKRGGVLLDYTNLLEIELSAQPKSRLPVVQNIQLQSSYSYIRQDYERLEKTLLWFNFLNKAIQESQVITGLFENLQFGLARMNSPEDPTHVDLEFKKKLLTQLGYHFDWEQPDTKAINKFAQHHLGFGF